MLDEITRARDGWLRMRMFAEMMRRHEVNGVVPFRGGGRAHTCGGEGGSGECEEEGKRGEESNKT